jgi:hypothetical protein
MKYEVTRFKSLTLALKDIEPFVRDGKHLLTGKPFQQFGNMRSREVLGNWLMCVVINAHLGKDSHTFTSDPQGSDGIILNTDTGETWPSEHVMVAKSYNSNEQNLSIEDRIINAFNEKLNKGGDAYASGKQLIIFLNSDGGSWNPRKVSKQLPRHLCFADVWVVGLLPAEAKQYVYSLSQLGTADRDAPTWKVYIEGDFCSWKVESIQ